VDGERDDVLTAPDGRRIGWLERGPADGAPVLYVHGWPGSRLEQALIPTSVLDRFRVRLISVDRPGYGNTDPLAGPRSARIRDVLHVADALGVDRFPVIGVSCGGANVLTLAAIAPERVTRVLAVSGQMPYDDDEAIATLAPDQLAELPLFRRGRTPELERACEAERASWHGDPIAWLEGALDTFSEAERRLVAEPWFRDALAADVTEALRPGSEGIVEDSLLCVQPFDVDVSAVRCPVLAVHGTADDWEPLPNLRRTLGTIEDVTLFLVDGANHLGPFRYPDLLLSLVAPEGARRTAS
jgi:pimeloyl-ACP methyl ester carboxylesterase